MIFVCVVTWGIDMANNVIRNWNTPNIAKTLSGHEIRRETAIYLKSHEAAYACLPTAMHFVYHDPTVPRGSTLICTCGAAGGVFGREGYKKWTSINYGNEVIACSHFIQYGWHADGSHE
jgi:hypothetical protein